ncbi:SAM-dependent methyltransferase [Streptomyces niveus]|uniref:SAM-dependent methyltransferase n=1 Tax=Streptomyces niveus TaxID=193462 RepID=UPI00369B882B
MPSAGTPKPQVDTSTAHPARVYDWLLGGKDNYEVDRVVGEGLSEPAKALARASARENRAFMRRTSEWLARRGVDQFLDIGTGIPTEPNLHQIVQGENPAARIVYVDNDPIVLRHAEALLCSMEEGATDYIQADVREPVALLRRVRDSGVLDFDRPIGLSLIALMHFIPDSDGPYDIVRTLLDSLAPGSHLTLSHGTFDAHPEEGKAVEKAYEKGGVVIQPRRRPEVEQFFEGLELVGQSGLVTVDRWPPPKLLPEPRGELAVSAESDGPAAVYGGVARVPVR